MPKFVEQIAADVIDEPAGERTTVRGFSFDEIKRGDKIVIEDETTGDPSQTWHTYELVVTNKRKEPVRMARQRLACLIVAVTETTASKQREYLARFPGGITDRLGLTPGEIRDGEKRFLYLENLHSKSGNPIAGAMVSTPIRVISLSAKAVKLRRYHGFSRGASLKSDELKKD